MMITRSERQTIAGGERLENARRERETTNGDGVRADKTRDWPESEQRPGRGPVGVEGKNDIGKNTNFWTKKIKKAKNRQDRCSRVVYLILLLRITGKPRSCREEAYDGGGGGSRVEQWETERKRSDRKWRRRRMGRARASVITILYDDNNILLYYNHLRRRIDVNYCKRR